MRWLDVRFRTDRCSRGISQCQHKQRYVLRRGPGSDVQEPVGYVVTRALTYDAFGMDDPILQERRGESKRPMSR